MTVHYNSYLWHTRRNITRTLWLRTQQS